MGIKFLWAGLTLISSARLLTGIPAIDIVGEILMIIGLVLFLLDK